MTTTWSASAMPDRLLVLGLAQPLGDLVVRVAPARAGGAPAPRATGGSTKISSASGCRRLDLPGAVDLDLEHHVAARRRLRASGVP